MKVAFFLENELLTSINWKNVMLGNPGVGGSEYTIVLTAYMLTLRSLYDVTLIAQKESLFPDKLKISYAENIHDAVMYCHENNILFLAFKENPCWIKEGNFDNLPHDVALIVWCHNFLSSSRMDFYNRISSVRSVICVGREQADLYRDHEIFKKMDYIYNGFPLIPKENIKKQILPLQQRENIVSYIGSIMPFKGFHLLAKAWPIVIKKIPNAQLYVIGSGKVYNDNKVLGKYGIADECYESVFMPYLTDINGHILPSVHFMGRMGIEKIEIIKQTKVGVPNPSGDTETFGIGAIEFEEMGCEVVTRRCCGYLDTVYYKKNLYSPRNAKALAKNIIKSLRNPTADFERMYQFIKENFSIEVTVLEWEKLFETLNTGNTKIHDFQHSVNHKTFRWKWFRILYAKINSILGYRLPCMTKLSENRLIVHMKWLMNKKF